MFLEGGVSRRGVLFAAGCALAYATAVLVTLPYTPLIQPDSASYLAFSPFRPALYPAFICVCRAIGLTLVEITWVQLAIFSVALCYLLIVLLRNGVPKWLLAIMVLALAGNVLFSSFHLSIVAESIYFSVSVVAVALWIEYFRTAKIAFLMAAGLALGLMIGICLAGLGVVPLHLLAVLVRRPKSAGLLMAVALAAVPVGIDAGSERLLAYAVHGSNITSHLPNLLFGKAAMLIRPGMKFSAPMRGRWIRWARVLKLFTGPYSATLRRRLRCLSACS